MEDLELVNSDNTVPLFSLNNNEYIAKVVDVYDGDSCKVVFRFHNNLTRWIIRIAHIDTPELRSKDEDEKKLAYLVRDFLRELILNKIVKIKCLDFDKYGRLLAEIYSNDNRLISDILLEKKYAKPYEGGTKEEW
jgi:micrococcal nuclease